MNGDKIQEELELMKKRRNAIHNDLNTFGAKLSAVSQVALIVEMGRMDNHIKDMNNEIDKMTFDSIVSDYFKEDDR